MSCFEGGKQAIVIDRATFRPALGDSDSNRTLHLGELVWNLEHVWSLVIARKAQRHKSSYFLTL